MSRDYFKNLREATTHPEKFNMAATMRRERELLEMTDYHCQACRSGENEVGIRSAVGQGVPIIGNPNSCFQVFCGHCRDKYDRLGILIREITGLADESDANLLRLIANNCLGFESEMLGNKPPEPPAGAEME